LQAVLVQQLDPTRDVISAGEIYADVMALLYAYSSRASSKKALDMIRKDLLKASYDTPEAIWSHWANKRNNRNYRTYWDSLLPPDLKRIEPMMNFTDITTGIQGTPNRITYAALLGEEID